MDLILMIAVVAPLSSLFISCFVLMLGFGLAGLLMPVRMTAEGVPTESMGMILAMYAVGMLIGGNYSRMLISRVGHIRIFAASAALAGIAVLACSLTMNPWVWGGMRMLMGLSIACSLAVIDGWLSDVADESNRGRILATNQVVITLGIFASQFMLNLAPVKEMTLFVLGGILMALALLPLVMSRRTGPVIAEMSSMSYRQLIQASPLGVACTAFCGVLYGALINMLPVYADHYEISGLALSVFMASAMLGAFILQYPIGLLSDRFDRRTILLYLLLACFGVTLLTPMLAEGGLLYPMMAGVAVITGIVSCLYPMGISETFDRIQRSQAASAMGGLLTIYAMGYIVGPLSSSYFMGVFGTESLFNYILLTQVLLLLFVIYRMQARSALPVDEQEPYVPQQAMVVDSALELDPRTQASVELNEEDEDASALVELAEDNPAHAMNMLKDLADTSVEDLPDYCATLAQVEGVDIVRLYKAISVEVDSEALEEEILYQLMVQLPTQMQPMIDWLLDEQPERLGRVTNRLLDDRTRQPDE